MDRIISLSINMKCNSKVAFEMFTVNYHLENWLTEMADVEPEVGGKYELFWNPKDKETDSTIGCKILAMQPNKFLSFEWKGPKQFKHFMNNVRPLTNVVVFFIPDQESTSVYVLHVGWRNTKEWENARQWFVKAWEDALWKLQKYVSEKRG
ncbi:MAG: SRPBCC domain-containing protein [Candidatus Hodarchaeota archaeon]